MATSAAAVAPEVTGSAKLSKVSLSALALLKIVQHGTRSLPELCAGSLLGVDDGQGALDVSECFPYPSASTLASAFAEETGEEAGERQIESDISDFRQDYLRMLRDSAGADDFQVGWYRTVNTGDWCTLDIVEQQFEHQEECDARTGLAKSVLVVYDPYQTENGQLSIKALRLTDAFMDVMRARQAHPGSSSAANANQQHADGKQSLLAADGGLAQLKMDDIFYEVPIEFLAGSTLARLHLDAHYAALAKQSEFDRLVLDSTPRLEKNLAFALEELDRLKVEQQNAANFQKFMTKQKQLQERWLVQRKQENAQREKRGEEPLPLRDASLGFFKTYRDSSKLNSLLVRKQIDQYCAQIDDAAAQSFQKLHVLSALQQQ